MLGLRGLRYFGRSRRSRRPAGGSEVVELYSLTPVGAAALSPRGRFLKTNRALQQFLGYSEEELLEMDFDSVTHREDLGQCRDLFERLRRGEVHHFQLDKRYVRKDGQVVWAHVIVTRDRRADGSGIIGLAVDITDRKRAEEALRRSEDKYRGLYARTPIMMHSIDRDDRLLSVSDRWLATLGYTREEVLGRRSVEFLTESSRRYAEEIVLPAYFETGSCSDVPYTFVRKDGSYVEVLLSATCERDEHGAVARSLAVLVDVTERRRAERERDHLRQELENRVRDRTAELELRNALLNAMQETSIDGILATDLERGVLAHNRRLLELWNAPEPVLASRDAADAVRHALTLVCDPKGFLRRVVHLYRQRFERALDLVELKDGRVLERFSGPILCADGRPIGRVWYYRDVTARRASERELERRAQALSRSNADLETYAYAASHDLSAPVRKISAYADLLARSAGSKLDSRESQMLGVIGRAARRMSTLIDDVLAFRRLGGEKLPLRPVDLSTVVEHVVGDLELTIAQKGARVSVGTLAVVLGQETHVRRLLQNLVANALKFQRPGARPEVTIQAEPAAGGFVELSVRDNGIGFEPRFAERIFRPFAQLNPVSAYAGNGMGLAICRRIAESCGGSIRAEGELGKGAVFTVRLRLAEPRPGK